MLIQINDTVRINVPEDSNRFKAFCCFNGFEGNVTDVTKTQYQIIISEVPYWFFNDELERTDLYQPEIDDKVMVVGDNRKPLRVAALQMFFGVVGKVTAIYAHGQVGVIINDKKFGFWPSELKKI